MAACCEGGTTPTGGYPYFLWCHGRAEMSPHHLEPTILSVRWGKAPEAHRGL